MTNKLLEGLEEEENYTRTENFALTYKSTKSFLLDFFAMGGALRTREEQEIISLFTKAFAEDSLLALKCLFYLRDVRGGQGERRTFRVILKYLGDVYPKLIDKNMQNIPEFGRWDDLYSLVDTKSEQQMFRYMGYTLFNDYFSDKPSLLAKWMKSENTSSKHSLYLARKTRKFFDLSHKDYRYFLSYIRRKLNIVESKMCANNWNEIEYSKVPSRAGLIYSKAFRKHDFDRYEKYLEDVESGKQKINVAVLYPYDIIRKVDRDHTTVKECDVMWNNQKDWLQGSDEKAIVVCDTSGSMMGGNRQPEPIHVSVSLAMYFAERNKGPFHNTFITFSEYPRFQKVVGNNILEKYRNLCNADWGNNTDLQAVFDMILNTGIKYKVPQEDMPAKIYIISDMEFDNCASFDLHTRYSFQRRAEKTNFEAVKEKYKNAGYEMPILVFWNVDSRHNNVPIQKDQRGVILVSGASPSTFEALLGGCESAVEMMLKVLNKERYNEIIL